MIYLLYSIFLQGYIGKRMVLGMKRKWIKVFLSVMLVLLIVELPAMFFHLENKLNATNGARKSSLNQYDQVKIGGSEYTYLGNDKYLLNDSLGTQSWAEASATANAYKETGSFSGKEKNFINASSLASKASINAGNNNSAISNLIPSMSDWWLSDVADQNYTRAYVNSSNMFNAGRIEKYQSWNGSACASKDRLVTGGLLSEQYTIPGETITERTTYYGYEFTFYHAGTLTKYAQDGVTKIGTVSVTGGQKMELQFPANFGSCSTIGYASTGYKMRVPTDGTFLINHTDSQLMKATDCRSNLNQTIGVDRKCTEATLNPASNANIRPMLDMTPSSLFTFYTSKDTNIGSILEPLQEAGNGAYSLQIIDDSLHMNLDSDHDTVKENNVIEIALKDVPDTGNIIIPYDTTGSSYDGGTPYISAMTDDDHYKKLSTATENGKGTAVLNINNIAVTENGQIIPQTIMLNLYQEEISADGHMDYISAPLSISIKINDDRSTQEIEQLSGDPTSITYGTFANLHFSAKGSADNPTSVSGNPITFSLSEEDQAYAELTDKGDGNVEVKPLKAGKTINIMVNKAGDAEHKDAPQLKVPLELKKKIITIKAESYTKDIGDDEPSYEISAGENDLVNGDMIPTGIKAKTTYIAIDGKLMTVTSGTDITIEEDDSADVAEFKEKYDITYVSGKLIVGKTTADETWLDVSPAPNANGWNTTNVIIKPSTLAISNGYTKITMNGGAQETEITIDSSTLKENMEFILYKENGSLTSEINLSNDIKIDKDAPITAITNIKNEDIWTKQKEVEFTITETGSGIKTITVIKPDGSEASVTTVLSSSTYRFIADQAGIYLIDVVDNAGNSSEQLSMTISKIDLTAINITDIINDGSADDDPWESVERVVTFNVAVGASGLKPDMPQVMMGSDNLTVMDNGNGNYSFTATKNGNYKIIAENGSGDKKEVTGTVSKIDKTAPIVTIDVDKVPETFAMRVLNALTGGAFYKGGFIVTVTAVDEESGINTITSPNGTGTVTTNGNTKTLTYSISENFKGTISAEANNMAGLKTTATTQIIVNENNNQTIMIQPTSVSGHINADDVFDAKLNATVSANQSGLKKISYFVNGIETDLQNYTSIDAEEGSLTLTDNIVIPLTTIIQNAPADQDELVMTIKVTTNSGNTMTKDITIQYDINAATIAIISVEKEHDWAYQKQVDFSVNEEGSGINSITVMKPDGTQAIVNGELTGSVFNFIADQSGVYTIDADDIAGNNALQISKNIAKIDRDIPTITDLSITPDNNTWSDKKTVSFHIKDLVDTDSGSGVDQSSIKITNISGTEETITCTGNKDDLTCSFEVSKEDTYSINAKDLAGNDAVSKDVEVNKIDTSHVDITDVKNDGSGVYDDWVNTGRIVTFKVTAGKSGLKTGMPQVLMESKSLTVTSNGNGKYSFTAPENGAYKIIAESETGDKKEVTGVISKIDKDAPVTAITEIENEDVWASDKKISFTVTETGSGIKKITVKKPDGSDAVVNGTLTGNSFSFIADQIGTYTIDAEDNAGNTAVQINKIISKIDVSVLSITNIKNDGSGVDDAWSNTGRIVTFSITVGQSGLKSNMPQVLMGSDSLTVTNNGNGKYSFTAPENGAYKIIAESEVGDKKEVSGTISKIDKTAPTISDLKLEQERDLTQHDSRVNVSFKTIDYDSGIAKVSYVSDDTEIILTSENDTYSFITSKNGTYPITVFDKAGNSEIIEAKVSIPKITTQPIDLSVYENDALTISIKADMNDTLQTGRTYEWFYIDEEGNEASIKTGILSSEGSEQMIPFPYSEGKIERSGNYRCMIKNGDGFYNWSNMFKLIVISDPVTGLVIIPSEIEMKNMNDASETAQAIFDIELGATGDNTVPTSKFYIETVKELLLKDTGTKDSYKAKVYKETGGSYLPYESGAIAELDYNGIKKQKVKLVMPVKEYHEQGIYQGILRFTIRYGEGGTEE